MIKTSLSHPLRIDVLPLAKGEVGLTFCPGKREEGAFGAAWRRDLELDLAAIRAWGAQAVLTLVERHEFALLGVQDLERAVQEGGMVWYHLPIPDMAALEEGALATWVQLSPQLHAVLEGGGKLLVHCRGGLGRTGMIAALLLIEQGFSAPQAIAMVREVRIGAIETREQERFLHRYSCGLG